jgi:hypothetical protein
VLLRVWSSDEPQCADTSLHVASLSKVKSFGKSNGVLDRQMTSRRKGQAHALRAVELASSRCAVPQLDAVPARAAPTHGSASSDQRYPSTSLYHSGASCVAACL